MVLKIKENIQKCKFVVVFFLFLACLSIGAWVKYEGKKFESESSVTPNSNKKKPT